MANFLAVLVAVAIASFTPWPSVGPTHVNPWPKVGQSSTTQWPEGSPIMNLHQATQTPQYPPGTWSIFNLPPGLEQVSTPFGVPNSNLDLSNSAPIPLYTQSDVMAKPESFFDSSVVDTNLLETYLVDFVHQRQGGGYSFNTMCSLLVDADFDHTQMKRINTDLTPTFGECPICCETEEKHLFRPVTCPSGSASSSSNVHACGKCWTRHLSISDTCMCKKCDPISLLPLIEKFGDLKLKARRRRHRVEKFGRFCGYTPCGNCNAWVETSFGNFICNCGNDFCTRCENKIHHPWTCREARELNFSADASEKVIEKTTKACPGCDSRIEKNNGCNHMTCWKSCGFEFCWICLKKWGDSGCSTSTCSSGRKDSDLIRSKKQWDEWESKMEGILNKVKKDFAKRNDYDLIRAARLVIASMHFMRMNGDAEDIIHKECGKLVDGMVALTKAPSKREKRYPIKNSSVDLGALVRNLENALGK